MNNSLTAGHYLMWQVIGGVLLTLLALLLLKFADNKSGAKKGIVFFLKTVVLGTFTWGLNGAGAATVISFFYLGFWAFYVFYDAIVPALLMGLIQTLWFYCERRNWGSEKDFSRFSAFSGILFGLLCFPPAFVKTETGHSLWGFCIFLAAAIMGGWYASGANKRILIPVIDFQAKTFWKKILPHGALILVVLASLDLFLYGSEFMAKIPIIPLASLGVLNLPIGSGQGTSCSGLFQLEGKTTRNDSGIFSKMEKNLLFVQKDGLLSVKTDYGSEWVGGIDANGKFKVGAEEENEGWLTKIKMEGRFNSTDHFTFSLQYTTITQIPRTHVTSFLDEGVGQRLEDSWQVEKFNNHIKELADKGYRWERIDSNGKFELHKIIK